MVSRCIDFQLNWQRKNEHVIMGPSGRLHRHDIDDETFGSTSFLSQSHHGSRRHLRSLASNALTIVSEYGKPTVFITLTCNPMWDEIQQMLLPGQSAFDRPEVVCEVFHHRLAAILYNIRSGKYFDDEDMSGDVTTRRTVVYELRCIEYQHRGLPHAHIVIRLSNIPEPSDPAACSDWIDNFLTCEYPVVDANSSPSDRQYLEAVRSCMVHTCSPAVNGCLDEHGVCRKGYHRTVELPRTTFCEKGYPIYKRRKKEDLHVVPHNRKLLLDWGGHAYIDWCGSTYTVLYLYKYLYKGAKKVKFRLENAEDVDDRDEITLYLRGRYLCSMDAAWRILGYHVSRILDQFSFSHLGRLIQNLRQQLFSLKLSYLIIILLLPMKES
jgi:hypothetical protein